MAGRTAGRTASSTMRLIKSTAWALCLAVSVDAFELGIHEDITQESSELVSRVVNNQILEFTQSAIDDLRFYNIYTDLWGFFTACVHCDSETFGGASQRLIDKKAEVIALLNSDAPDGEKAREELGTAIHTLQDFYAHTNWVNIHQDERINTNLGRATFRATSNTNFRLGNDPTALNPEVTELTSGYYSFPWPCADPPPGKALHGQSPFCDGINKDSPDRPLHALARSVATNSSIDFINQILDDPQIKDNPQAIAALMGVTSTLAIVLNMGSSMASDIEAVKNHGGSLMQNVVSRNRIHNQSPRLWEFLLVEYGGNSNPDKVLKTTNPSDFQRAVNSLSPYNIRQSSSWGMSALITAVQESRRHSQVYLMTDSSATDHSKGSQVVDLAREKDITITAILTDDSNTDPSYLQLVEETGGQVFSVEKGQMGQVLDVIGAQTDHTVPIGRWRANLATLGGKATYSFPVDSTVEVLVITVSYMDKGSSSKITRPDSTVVAEEDSDVNTAAVGSSIEVVTLSSPDVGNWSIDVEGTGDCSIKVQARSILQLSSFVFVETVVGRYEDLYRILPGYPITGSTTIAKARLVGPVSSYTFSLQDQSGMPLVSKRMIIDEANSMQSKDDIILKFSDELDQACRVVVSGVTDNGDVFQRVVLPTVSNQPLQIKYVPTVERTNLVTSETSVIPFDVKNYGAETMTVQVDVTDSRGYISEYSPSKLTLSPGESDTIQVKLKPTEKKVNVETDVTVSVHGMDTRGRRIQNAEKAKLPLAACQTAESSFFGRFLDRLVPIYLFFKGLLKKLF